MKQKRVRRKKRPYTYKNCYASNTQVLDLIFLL